MGKNRQERYKYETADASLYKILQQRALQHRNYPTQAEAVLWEYLKGNRLGAKFRRQHLIGQYIPDFVCLSKQLIIEVDGGYHFIGDQIISDEQRTAYLESFGYHVIRFTNEEVLADTQNVLQKIRHIMNHLNEQNKQQTVQNTTSTDKAPLLRRGGGRLQSRLIIFSAPSGSGKSTIVNWLMQEHPELKLAFSISCTSRQPRGTERDGVEYFFVSPQEFRERIDNDEFLEYEEVYEDRFYGTLKTQVDNQLKAGQNVVFDVDVKGGVNIKRFYGDRALSIFIQPPSIDELRRRLESRATDAPQVIEDRLNKAAYELTFASQFDKVVVNDDLDKAKTETLQIIQEFLRN
ncbi:guanylate kinase [Hoylesella timonensis]|uniref:Guanylate kinase n=1 Tax=Hoylesella timonensis CRIS 5C-B1 TaxID=679189 RepID=D1W0W6_9BACT|nr:guanylate kinase [Hoylesella timonensis]EFA97032.1 guanylate kinase [Hoylesella timonensis CRIS 5C-B1]